MEGHAGELTDEDIRDGELHAAYRNVAFTAAVGFDGACREFPERVAKSLACLHGFDLGAVRAEADRTVAILHAVADQVQGVRLIAEECQRMLDRIEEGIAQLEMRSDKAGLAMDKLAELFRNVARLAQGVKR